MLASIRLKAILTFFLRNNKPETAFKHQIMQTVFTYQSRRSIMHYPVVLSNKVLPEQTAKQINHWSKAISQVLPCTRTWWKLRFQSTKWKIDEFVLLTFIYIIHLCLYHKLTGSGKQFCKLHNSKWFSMLSTDYCWPPILLQAISTLKGLWGLNKVRSCLVNWITD